MNNKKQTSTPTQIRLEQAKIVGLFAGVAVAAIVGQRKFRSPWTRKDSLSVGSAAASTAITLYREHEAGAHVTPSEVRRSAFPILLNVAGKTLVLPASQRAAQKDKNLGAAVMLAWTLAARGLTLVLARTEDRLAALEAGA